MTAKHADPLELAQEALEDKEARLQSVWTDLSWRAKRYAMDGNWVEHDVMNEALISFLDTIEPPTYDRDKADECDCRQRYGNKGDTTPHKRVREWLDFSARNGDIERDGDRLSCSYEAAPLLRSDLEALVAEKGEN